MAYAAKTDVGVSKTRGQIEFMLARAGASKFGYMGDDRGAKIFFEISNRQICFSLPLPDRKQFECSPGGRVRKENSIDEAVQQAERARWRALFLCIKAKLEAIEVGITTFESEFLAHIVIKGGKTIGETMLPRLDEIGRGGALLLN